MRLSTAIKRAMTSQTTEGELASYDELLEEYGSNRGIANAAGVSDPKSKESRALMRNLQRYAKGRAPMPTTLLGLAQRMGRPGELLSLADVVEAMRAEGMTFLALKAEITVSADTRDRDISTDLLVEPALLTAALGDFLELEGEEGESFLDACAGRHWAAAARAFVPAVLTHTYGMPRAEVGDVEELQIGVP